jgi:hypothetical protein
LAPNLALHARLWSYSSHHHCLLAFACALQAFAWHHDPWFRTPQCTNTPISPAPSSLCIISLSLSLSLSFSCARTHVCLCVPLSLCLSCVSPCLRWVEFGKSNNNYPKDFSPGDPPPQPKGSAAKKARSKGSLSFCLSLERELDANGLHAL